MSEIKINAPLPFDDIDTADEFLTVAAVQEIGTVLEKAGFSAGSVTDHPCPTGRWLDAGGHHAQDPFVMLSMIGAVTTSLRLQTGILVLPYRNPFLVARAVATLDRITDGRVTLSVGTGYLKGEYRALGVDFGRRNELTDEYLDAITAALSGREFAFEGEGFRAYGNRILPGPVQQPRPPILVGGNSKKAIRRAVERGDGWNPFLTSVSGADLVTTRTAGITGEDDLRRAISYMREVCEKHGRGTLPEIVLGGIIKPSEPWDPQKWVDRIGRYRELGVSAVGVNFTGRTRAEWCDTAERFGTELISQF
ncbi:LLM class F420-dependent oxidoreductase [Rhodococcus artemisiae]|uniref:LLM class F420-dependent oxidoreductase n=1 Tax=Rhodococcus artemisiae TaxID=714159 RepID=A0ABU7L5Y2_9NOCA|nr:LLM class F420-dependent oxidoreductase [Rhodococcus artemisiae]MEE2056913.1 LLM class F420-dependent oxidoreductase [Rhodococcus artemisiae]